MPINGCLSRYVRVDNTAGVANMNFYEIFAYDAAMTNVALNKPASARSIWNVANGPNKANDGVTGESSYYNSLGTGSTEYLLIDLMSSFLLKAVAFVNRNPQVSNCWTPPAAWTAAGIPGSCDTRAINSTLSVLDATNRTLFSVLLNASLLQTFYMTCSASPTATASSTVTASSSATQTATASLTRGVSASPTISTSWSATATLSASATASCTPSASLAVPGCAARYVRYQNTPGIANINFVSCSPGSPLCVIWH